ncbi:hypothetical protein T439DRAFT_381896 [Meredithblackwellia eburnea MCA 4105]
MNNTSHYSRPSSTHGDHTIEQTYLFPLKNHMTKDRLTDQQVKDLRASIKLRAISDFYLTCALLKDLTKESQETEKEKKQKTWRYHYSFARAEAGDPFFGNIESMFRELEKAAEEVIQVFGQKKNQELHWVENRAIKHWALVREGGQLDKFATSSKSHSILLSHNSPFRNIQWDVTDEDWVPRLEQKFLDFFKAQTHWAFKWALKTPEMVMFSMVCRNLQDLVEWSKTSASTIEIVRKGDQKGTSLGGYYQMGTICEILEKMCRPLALAKGIQDESWDQVATIAMSLCASLSSARRDFLDQNKGNFFNFGLEENNLTRTGGIRPESPVNSIGRRYRARLCARGLGRVIARFNERYGSEFFDT